MTDAEMLFEITNDPAQLGYAELTADQIVEKMNQPNDFITFPVIVPVAVVLQIFAQAPFRAAQLSEPDRTGWLETLSNIRALKEGLNPSDPGIAQLLNAAVIAGVVTAEERASLDALKTRVGSRAEQVWGEGTVVSLNDVARVI